MEEDSEFPVRLDIEIYPKGDQGKWAQAKFLVHGYDDVMWTDHLEQALLFLKRDVKRLLSEKQQPEGE